MTKARTESKWWLAAYILPILAVGIGYLFALGAPFDQNDWLGMRFVVPVLYGIAGGCILSCLVALISFLSKERLAGAALLPAIPSLCFLVWLGAAINKAKDDKKKQDASEIVRRKHEAEKMKLIGTWKEKFRNSPDLITNDDIWRAQTDPEQVARFGLVWLLQDKSFEVNEQIKDYVIVHFPDDYGLLAHRKLVTKADLERVVANPKTGPWPREFAKRAIASGDFRKETEPNRVAGGD